MIQRIVRYGLLLFVLSGVWLVYMTYVLSKQGQRNEQPVLRVLAGEIQPLVTGGGSGAEVERVQQLLDQAGLADAYALEVTTYPFTRHWRHSDASAGVDLIMTVPPDYELGWSNSLPYVRYQNGVIYRRSRFPEEGLGAAPLEALQGRRVIGFAGAVQVIKALKQVRPELGLYLERKNQYRQAFLLASGFADAVIAERTVFEHYLADVAGVYDLDPDAFVFDPVFCPTDYALAVRDGAVLSALNGVLEAEAAPRQVERLVEDSDRGAAEPGAARLRIAQASRDEGSCLR